MQEISKSIYQEAIYLVDEPLTIVIAKPWTALEPREVELLSKILWSIKQSLSSVKVVYQSIVQVHDLPARRIILFGATANPQMSSYELILSGNKLIIQAESLDQLDEAKKKSLWRALKQMVA